MKMPNCSCGKRKWRNLRDIALEVRLFEPKSSKTLVTILRSCQHSRSPHQFPDSHPIQMQLEEWRHHHAADVYFLQNSVDRQSVFHRSIYVQLPGRRLVPNNSRTRVTVSFKRYRLGWYGWRHHDGSNLLPYRLTALRYRNFLETVLLGQLGVMPIAVRLNLWLSDVWRR
jgi:hypothetical protein